MKKVILILAILFVIVVGALIAAVFMIDKELIKNKVAEVVENTTGKPLIIKDTPSISINPLGISLGNVSWGKKTPDGKADDLFVSAESAKVQVALLPLFSGQIIIEEIVLDSPSISMLQKKTGEKVAPKVSSADSEKSEKSKVELGKFELSSLSIKNGSILYDDGTGQIVNLNNFSMSLSNVKLGEDVSFKLESNISLLDPELAGNLAVEGKAVLQNINIIDVHPLTMEFTPSKGMIPPKAGPVKIKLEGAYDLDAGKFAIRMLQIALNSLKFDMSGDLQTAKSIAFKGNINLDTAPSKAVQPFGITLPDKGFDSFKFETPISYSGNSLVMGDIKSKLNDTSINGNVFLKTGQIADIKVKLEINSVDIDDYLTEDSGKNSYETSKNKPFPEKEAAQKTVYPALDADLLIRSLTANKIEFKDIAIKIKGSNGNYNIDPFDFIIGTGGQFTSKSSVDLTGMKHRIIANFFDCEIGSLMKAVNGKNPVDGKAVGDLNVAFYGMDAKTIQSSLSGTGNVNVKDVKLIDPSVVLSKIPMINESLSDIYQISIPFNAINGVVNLSEVNLTSNTNSLNGKAQGVVDLKQEQVDITADLKFINTAVPLRISGPFSKISYGVDATKIIKTIAENPAEAIDAGKKTIENIKDQSKTIKEQSKEGLDTLKEIFKK